METMDLSDPEIRVLGCLLEKQRTTPDHYPLSLNSLRLACNQSTNREPVVQYDEALIRDALHRLGRRGWVRLAGASRAAKYRHLLADVLPMSNPEQAVMCVLMLRGPQTPGELKQRGERIHSFGGLDEVHVTLTGLVERGLVARLGRRPGQKEERYEQLLGEDAEPEGTRVQLARGAGVVSSGAGEISFSGVEQGAPLGPRSSGPISSSGAAFSPGPATSSGPASSPGPATPAGAASSADLAERVARLEREVAELRAAISESSSVNGERAAEAAP